MNRWASLCWVNSLPRLDEAGCDTCRMKWSALMELVPCGHAFCSTCFPEVKVCPLCKRGVIARRPPSYGAKAHDRVPAERGALVDSTAFVDNRVQKDREAVTDAVRLTNRMGGAVPSNLHEQVKKFEASGWKIMDLSGCTELSNATALSPFTALEELNISGYRRVRYDLDTVVMFGSLRKLYLDETDADDMCIYKISSNRNLTFLSCANCHKVTDVEPLAEVTSLEGLTLAGCKNIKHGLAAVCALPQLRTLNLRGTGVNDVCIYNLGQVSILTHLDCGSCPGITDVGPLASLIKLEVITMEGCENIRRGLVDVCALPNIREMCLSGTPVDNACISKMSTSTSLVNLVCERCMNITDIKPLVNIKTLESLSLNGSLNVRKGVTHFCRKQRVRILNLSGVAVRNRAVAALAKNDSTVALTLSGCSKMKDLSAMEGCTKLEILHLCDCTKLIDITELGQYENLTMLNLSGCERLDDVSALGECKRLETLDLSQCTELSELSGLGECRTLMSLNLSGCHSLVDISALCGCTNLETLRLCDCNSLPDLGVLRECQRLQVLDLSDLRIVEDFSVVSEKGGWTVLNFSSCENLKDACLNGHEFSNLLTLDLSNCENLTEIWLDGCGQLTTLSLRNCKSLWYIHGQGECRKLVTVDLYKCGTIQNGIVELVKLPRLATIHVDSSNADWWLIKSLRDRGVEVLEEEEEEEEGGEEGGEEEEEDVEAKDEGGEEEGGEETEKAEETEKVEEEEESDYASEDDEYQ